jgi:hypothetical protein
MLSIAEVDGDSFSDFMDMEAIYHDNTTYRGLLTIVPYRHVVHVEESVGTTGVSLLRLYR